MASLTLNVVKEIAKDYGFTYCLAHGHNYTRPNRLLLFHSSTTTYFNIALLYDDAHSPNNLEISYGSDFYNTHGRHKFDIHDPNLINNINCLLHELLTSPLKNISDFIRTLTLNECRLEFLVKHDYCLENVSKLHNGLYVVEIAILDITYLRYTPEEGQFRYCHSDLSIESIIKMLGETNQLRNVSNIPNIQFLPLRPTVVPYEFE